MENEQNGQNASVAESLDATEVVAEMTRLEKNLADWKQTAQDAHKDKLDAQEALSSVALLNPLEHLTDEQTSAIRGKLKNTKIDYIKETGRFTDSVVLAYIVWSARKEADAAIFSQRKQSMLFDLLRDYMGFVSASIDVISATHRSVDKVVEECSHDVSKHAVLLTLVRKEIMSGKLQMPDDKKPAFLKLCEYMGVDHETLR